jgi:hypothetical protein
MNSHVVSLAAEFGNVHAAIGQRVPWTVTPRDTHHDVQID